jgi:hypothetical protein
VPPPISISLASGAKARASSSRTALRCAATLRHSPKRASKLSAMASNARAAG